MDDTESMNTLTLVDLNTVLAQMTSNDGNCETEEPCEDETVASIKSVYDDSPDNVTQMIVNDGNCETKETYGDEGIPTFNSDEDYTASYQVAAACLVDHSNNYDWHLGVVKTVTEDCLHISFFQRASKDATRWNVPEVENVHPTCRTQIL